jgi:hypothetical protein
VTAFGVSRSARPSAVPEGIAADQCQSIGRVNAACRLGYASGLLAPVVHSGKKPQLLAAVSRPLRAAKCLRVKARRSV